ncbi:hypothetical protein ACVZYT_004209, partial [Yersinia enterocolitica]
QAFPGGSSRAIRGADALLFSLSSPCKIESLEFVSSLKPTFPDVGFLFFIFHTGNFVSLSAI